MNKTKLAEKEAMRKFKEKAAELSKDQSKVKYGEGVQYSAFGNSSIFEEFRKKTKDSEGASKEKEATVSDSDLPGEAVNEEK